MDALYVHHRRVESLAETLAARGFGMAAEELRREAYKLGCQISQVQGVLDDCSNDIAKALHEKPAKFYGVDMAKPGVDCTNFQEVDTGFDGVTHKFPSWGGR